MPIGPIATELYPLARSILCATTARDGGGGGIHSDNCRLKGAQDDVYVTTRSLDDPGAGPPDEHVSYGERAPWLHVVDDLPHHEGVSREPTHRQLATMTGRE